MKIIPAVDLMNGQVVRLYKGDPKQKTVYSDNPIEIAKKWEADGADMLHIVDLDATLGIGSNLSIIKKILEEISIPVEVAGGLRDESLILDVVKISSRVVIGTLAFKDKELLKKLLLSLGPEKIVISVDHIDGEIVIHGWQDRTGIKLIESIKEFLEMGFTEFLLTNVNRDGTLEGPDLEFLEQVCQLDNVNVIASGGISNVNDVKDVKEKNAFGVILGKALYENKISIEEAKKIA
ncbi:1-(5-phosphoribosyl)-5-[(5-phosphoribosylamino)methylideneamino]imidazole-4-carboxamide isomerase [Marine Group I thaumarchaeote]|jgi:phosphoribosylformimino-5-aminoimidazole carboxamide ribotide isomerase|uniref:1-(5-phosphoribosyl)-5-[(5-phosphoribosylamino)methylideneamino] imidazole-4-carboxamide isomerase n=1 Tax=Marine Group I thaumarchaeote TaxID=2511932 RepID=A0A7K4MJR5_9ARCH|nr:MAG: 1-(5-phosphoribosyl)-5-[(5-phosphoribosylamino)methylideneamino]imidazole-4-carboxamide isomerase [Nitrosopumilus sp. YT1]NMI82887.1 1-(5-phosphoribosyl)-5-[(5-phosphoribosylamino)methylideneamino]imidazole-4-carboxamide isomerase [Candidatus Nitrosopumilus sp. MTA1]NWJ20087.1 1-(5-phosphoribosyl)-5-[(5-phosphoribosylamino)methylideneamino]imidazole-4-carboxamide isomerase [Marine Group I thaumarchaeote]NWJ27998.1 1-(5-phosphoribosyl)-5-[(5-phosphoribosylamino)methylideneamino]imidazole-